MINYVNNSFDKVLKPCDADDYFSRRAAESTEVRLDFSPFGRRPKGCFARELYRARFRTGWYTQAIARVLLRTPRALREKKTVMQAIVKQ